MYLVNSAIGVKFGLRKKWEPIDLATLPVASLYATYRKVWITLTTPSDATPRYLDMDAIRLAYTTFDGPFSALLTALGSASLPTVPTGPVFRHRSAKYRDAFKAGYTVTPVTPANSASDASPAENKTAVRLTRTSPATNYREFVDHCLVSVNGFYHLADTDGVNGVVVLNAMRSAVKSRQNQLGLLSFSSVCALQCVPITAQMLTPGTRGQMYVTLPNDLTGKTALLVLGGYLHVADPVAFTRTSEQAFRIDFLSLPWPDRFYESRRYLDLSSLPLEGTNANESQVLAEDLFKPEVLSAYLRLSQTFVVLLDCPEIYTQQQYIKRTGLPGMYIAYSEPQGPLVMELGRHPEYWSVLEDGQYALSVQDNFVENRIYDTTQTARLASVDASRVPVSPAKISSAYLLEIGRDV